ncbi:DUF2786 domain-containing protein (plasmid) [Mycolicibacterium fortuitum]|nr:DUF2786 domain-containing protein [Mycolicibacterium fortuitum]
MSTDKTMARIGALLLRAEGTDNRHEADACITRAQTLATLNSIDIAVARAHAVQRRSSVRPQQKSVEIGAAGRRGLRTFVDLFLVVARANNVKIDIARDFTTVYTFGYREDLDVTEILYTSLVTQMVAACETYLASGDYHRELVEYGSQPGGSRKVSKITARLEFHAAFTARIRLRLNEARQAAAATSSPNGGGTNQVSSGALVLATKELEVQDYYAQHSRAKGRRYRGHRSGTQSDRSRAAGDQAALSAVLHPPAELASGVPALICGEPPS